MKSNYSRKEINKFVNNIYKANIILIPVVEGQESQVYSFTFKDKEYIIRINSNIEGFKKDKYVANNFISANLPIPKVINIGKFNETHYYCISEKINGTTYEDSSVEVIEKLLPNITNVWESISKLDISNTSGYGIFSSETGNAPYATWKDFLLEILDIKYNWDKIKTNKFVDKELIDRLINDFRNLLEFVPEVRNVFHGDFGSNNVLVNDVPEISGVIDWDCAGYGDSFYDIAISYFWSTWLVCMDRTSKYWDKKFNSISNYKKIIKCYELHIGLKEIYENACENDEESLNWLQKRCKQILDN